MYDFYLPLLAASRNYNNSSGAVYGVLQLTFFTIKKRRILDEQQHFDVVWSSWAATSQYNYVHTVCMSCVLLIHFPVCLHRWNQHW